MLVVEEGGIGKGMTQKICPTMEVWSIWHGSKPTGKQALLSGRTFQGLRDDLPDAEGKGQTSLWERLILQCSGRTTRRRGTPGAILEPAYHTHRLETSPYLSSLSAFKCLILKCDWTTTHLRKVSNIRERPKQTIRKEGT